MSASARGADPFDGTAGKRSVAHLARASETIDRVLTVLPERVRLMVDAMNGHPTGRGFDTVGGRASVKFCEDHERDACPCGSGTTYPTPSDPTGDAALPSDAAKVEHDLVVKLAARIDRDAEELARAVARWKRREATPMERQETTAHGERDVPCWSCSRLSRWEPAVRSAELDGERRELCWWCFDWVRKGDGLPPSREQVDRHHRGQRVRRSA